MEKVEVEAEWAEVEVEVEEKAGVTSIAAWETSEVDPSPDRYDFEDLSCCGGRVNVGLLWEGENASKTM